MKKIAMIIATMMVSAGAMAAEPAKKEEAKPVSATAPAAKVEAKKEAPAAKVEAKKEATATKVEAKKESPAAKKEEVKPAAK